MMSSSIEALEVKVAFLEDAISKLSDEFYTQQKELMALMQHQQLLMTKLQEAQSSQGDSTESIDERPPHY